MSWWGASLLILTMSDTLILFKNRDVHTQSIQGYFWDYKKSNERRSS